MFARFKLFAHTNGISS